MIKISVITICYNAEAYIEQTFRSVAQQSYPNLEYIVIDGGSSDGTLALIQRYQHLFNYWHSEPDKGIADAMNKGLAQASGDYILLLHADDYLVNEDALSDVSVYLASQADIYGFNVLFQTQNQRILKRSQPFCYWTRFKPNVMHQGVLCKREVFERLGGFDVQFRIAMDFDFFLRVYWQKIQFQPIDHTLAVMRDCGVSSRLDRCSLIQRLQEEKCAHLKNCPSVVQRLGYMLYWFLYRQYKLYLKQN